MITSEQINAFRSVVESGSYSAGGCAITRYRFTSKSVMGLTLHYNHRGGLPGLNSKSIAWCQMRLRFIFFYRLLLSLITGCPAFLYASPYRIEVIAVNAENMRYIACTSGTVHQARHDLSEASNRHLSNESLPPGIEESGDTQKKMLCELKDDDNFITPTPTLPPVPDVIEFAHEKEVSIQNELAASTLTVKPTPDEPAARHFTYSTIRAEASTNDMQSTTLLPQASILSASASSSPADFQSNGNKLLCTHCGKSLIAGMHTQKQNHQKQLMGQSPSSFAGPGGLGGQGKDQQDEENKDAKRAQHKKYTPPPPPQGGGSKRRQFRSAVTAAQRLPDVKPHAQCRLRLLKLQRINDYLLLEEEYITNQSRLNRESSIDREQLMVDELRGSPMKVGVLEEIIDENHAIVSGSDGLPHYVNIMSFVDRDKLEPGGQVLLHSKQMSIIGVLSDEVDPMVRVMMVEKAPKESYVDIGGLEKQIQEIKEAVELPLTHQELYDEMGISPPKGVIFYGPPGTGKTLLAKAVAHHTSATFLHVVGSELIQKHLGDGARLVRELFRAAEEYAPSIVFIDEIDAVGTKRYESHSSGENEIKRTMLELLNQLDGFDSRTDVKVIMATNRIEALDPALIRPGRIDRKIEFPVPDSETQKKIFNIHTAKMALAEDVNLEEFIITRDNLSGADIKAICTEAGLLALRERRIRVTQTDFRKAREQIMYLKNECISEGLYL